jgi:putative sterol carrier protein
MPKLQFGSSEWVQALQDELNKSPAYEDAARNWEGDFYFVVDPEGPVTEPIYLYMDLWHGKSREAFVVADPKQKNPAFVMSGKYGKWKQVVTAKLDPIQALATGQLKLKGNMVTILKNVKAAQEIVRACTRLDSEFVM